METFEYYCASESFSNLLRRGRLPCSIVGIADFDLSELLCRRSRTRCHSGCGAVSWGRVGCGPAAACSGLAAVLFPRVCSQKDSCTDKGLTSGPTG